jgi:serine/threonine protein kinase
LAKDKSTGEKCAIKIIEKNQIKNIKIESRILFEKSINKIIEHMNIIKTKGLLKIQKKYI